MRQSRRRLKRADQVEGSGEGVRRGEHGAMVGGSRLVRRLTFFYISEWLGRG